MSYNRIATTVYLNHALSHLVGFGAAGPAELRAAASFTLDMAGRPHQDHIKAALETVFDQLNIDEPATTWALGYRNSGLRSLSVGDVVVIGETAWACAASGWDLLTAEQLHAAIYD
jgi:hypothetical protein